MYYRVTKVQHRVGARAQMIDAEEKFKELMGGMMPLMTGPPEILNGAEF